MMAVSSAVVTVGTAATALNAPGTAGLSLHIRNGATAVDLGASTVTTGNGFSLAADEVLAVAVDAGDVLFAITGTGTSDVEVLRT